MEYLDGPELFQYLVKNGAFKEKEACFVFKQIVLNIDCKHFYLDLHSLSIIHRDIKPENLVFDEQGYLSVTDLGIARVWNPENAKDTSGTPGYMAPEVMCR